MSSDIERRMAAELRAQIDGENPVISGYAAVYNSETVIAGLFREVVEPGAFDEAIRRRDDAVLLVDHEGLPLARTRSGTLKITSDDHGLKVESELDPSDPDVQRLVAKMRRGDLDKMSFAFTADVDEWDHTDEIPLRRIRSVTLYDVSVVTFPAYDATSVSLRAKEMAGRNEIRTADWAADAQRRLRLLEVSLRSGTRCSPVRALGKR